MRELSPQLLAADAAAAIPVLRPLRRRASNWSPGEGLGAPPPLPYRLQTRESGGVAGSGRVVVAQAGAGADEVEHLDDLGAEAARESCGAADGVLTRYAALLVGGGSQR